MKQTILAVFNTSWMIWGAYQITKWVARTLETHPRLMEVAVCICIACFRRADHFRLHPVGQLAARRSS